ncbi:MAG: mannose-6-phosphate isomerase [Flavobacterium sp.]|nr:mannose-6-phosphate isomerase [Flavobacterium sp.]
MKNQFYPLTFIPIMKERIWGGTKLADYLHKSIPYAQTGESWELSTIPGDVSVVNAGHWKGTSLQTLLDQYPVAILGSSVHAKYGTQFPLLFKYLDAREDLSIQVHPNDELAAARHNSFGKTEMWYVMQADPDSRLLVGFNQNTSADAYVRALKDKNILSLLDAFPVQQGEVFFLETGTVHAIGAGCLIAEIQQTSDITYRLYDFDRVDAQGNTRELHLDLALDAINYNKVEAKKSYNILANESTNMVNCPYFTTNHIRLDGQMTHNKNGESFTVYMCTEGVFSLEVEGLTYDFELGSTVLVPAVLNHFTLHGSATLLEIQIK